MKTSIRKKNARLSSSVGRWTSWISSLEIIEHACFFPVQSRREQEKKIPFLDIAPWQRSSSNEKKNNVDITKISFLLLLLLLLLLIWLSNSWTLIDSLWRKKQQRMNRRDLQKKLPPHPYNAPRPGKLNVFHQRTFHLIIKHDSLADRCTTHGSWFDKERCKFNGKSSTHR